MIFLYGLDKDRLVALEKNALDENPGRVIWIDLVCPTPDEEKHLEHQLTIELPMRDEMQEIELSSRLYQVKDTVYATAALLVKADTHMPRIESFSFILDKKRLITIRYADTTAFRVFTEWAMRGGCNWHCSGATIMAGLLEAVIDRLADILESAGRNLDDCAGKIFRHDIIDNMERQKSKPNYEEMLQLIALESDRVSKARESLMSITRLLSFITHTRYFEPNSRKLERVKTMQEDLPSLSDHANFLSNKVTFLLDATLGMISIEQNRIIKLFSVAAVVFLPPTLVASIYGMNFKYMPELDWHYGYPLAICGMILSAIIPYLFFKKKRWL